MKSASAPADRRIVSGRALARRMAALDPIADHEELTHLSLEVRYGDPLFVHAAYTIAFARQVAIPTIARTVYRGGTGDMMLDVRRRNNDTLVFFGEMLRHGHSSDRGRAVIDRMEQIHSRFGISQDDKLFTLGSLAFEADRILGTLGIEVFTSAEDLARYHFWRGVGERMGLDVPVGREEFYRWTLDYEREHMNTTTAGRVLVEQLLRDWRQRWFPGPLHHLAAPTLLALFDRPLRAVHQLPESPELLTRSMSRLAKPYLDYQAARPHRLQRSWSDHFGAGHPRLPDLATLGHQRRGRHQQPSPQRPR